MGRSTTTKQSRGARAARQCDNGTTILVDSGWVGRGLVAPLGAATGVAVHPALLAKAGGCGTHAPLSFLQAWSTRTGPAPGDAIEVRQSSPKPRPWLRCSGASRGFKTAPDPAPAERQRPAADSSANDPLRLFARSGKRKIRKATRSANRGIQRSGARVAARPTIGCSVSTRRVLTSRNNFIKVNARRFDTFDTIIMASQNEQRRQT